MSACVGTHPPDEQAFLGKTTGERQVRTQYNGSFGFTSNKHLKHLSVMSVPTLSTGFISRAIDRADVIIFGVMDGVVKGYRLHNVWVWPGGVGRVVLHPLCLGT